MDFVIGRIPPPASPPDRQGATTGHIEARVLHVRPPRRRRGGQESGTGTPTEARHPGSPSADPPGARVLVLLVPDAHRLPDDLSDVEYRVFLRIVRK